ncbi:MAG: PAS domain S-box protein [Desulfoarculaceae bacterium]|nr:PAS domain S-box protein [Desulfoarculaceae bacterium]
MRKKAIIGFIILTILFLAGGTYIITANNRAISKLENVIILNEVAHRRLSLLNRISLTQADLLLADSPHATDIDTVIAHGEEVKAAAVSCTSCHHSEAIMEHFTQVRAVMNDYLKKISSVYTIRANRQRLIAELESAVKSGEQLYSEVSKLSILSADKIHLKIAQAREDISKTKNLLLTLVISGPLVALLFIFVFIRLFTTSISVLVRATNTIRKGDLTHTITEPLHDEFQDLATAFNQMTVSLEKQCAQVVAAESRYKTLFESAVDGIFILEAEGEQAGAIIAANQAAADMHGYSRDELTRLKIDDLNTRGIVTRMPEKFQRLMNGEKIESRAEHRRKDGTVFQVEFSAGLLEIEGKKYVLAFDRDISLRVKTEEALLRSRQLATVGQMAAGLAHEIKNPLAGIKVSMEVLVNELHLSPEDKEIFLRILKEIQRIETLLRNLLNYARPPLPTFSLIDLNGQLENCIKNAEMILKSPEHGAGEQRRQITWHKDLAPSLPLIKADGAQLQQIFLNLLLNAIEATPGEGTISVATRLGSNDTVLVEVSDTGKGMTPEACAEIFKPFFTTKPKGSGLGLAITSRLVELHGGSIEVGSVPGQGTTFTINFPVEQGQEAVLP